MYIYLLIYGQNCCLFFYSEFAYTNSKELIGISIKSAISKYQFALREIEMCHNANQFSNKRIRYYTIVSLNDGGTAAAPRIYFYTCK